MDVSQDLTQIRAYMFRTDRALLCRDQIISRFIQGRFTSIHEQTSGGRSWRCRPREPWAKMSRWR